MSRGNGGNECVDLTCDYMMYFVDVAQIYVKDMIADTEKMIWEMRLSTVRYNENYRKQYEGVLKIHGKSV